MTVEGGNVVNSDGDGSECREPYYALPLWKEYLAAKARWEEAHPSIARCLRPDHRVS